MGGIVFMGGVRSMLTDELEHWETVLLARRRPSHWNIKSLGSLPTKRDCCSTRYPHDVPPIAKTELVCTDMLVTLDGTVRTSSLIWLTTCTQDFMTLIIIITIASLLSQGHCCRHRQDVHLVFSMTSVKSCISKLGCRNDQAVWNTKKMTNANASRKKCQYRKFEEWILILTEVMIRTHKKK